MKMQTRKTSKRNRDVIVYIDAFGRKTVIKEGDLSVPDNRIITKEDIENYHRLFDSEVRNNIKHSKVRMTEAEEKKVQEWEDAHPGETSPLRYHVHLDQYSNDPDSDIDRSEIARRISENKGGTAPTVECLREVIAEMPKKYRYILIQVEYFGRTVDEVAEECGVHRATAFRWYGKAIEFI